MVDWNKVMGGMTTVANALVQAKQHYDLATFFQNLLSQERETARLQLSAIVGQFNSQEFDQFEITFLRFAGHLIDPNSRIRATELYGWLKVQELKQFGQWRGFVNWST